MPNIPVWNARQCIVCKKSHPQWQMVAISLDTGRTRNFIVGYACKNAKCQDSDAVKKALERKRSE